MEQAWEPRRRARLAGALVLALGVLQAARLLSGDEGTWLRVLGGAWALLAVPTVVALWCRRCFEAYLLAVVVAAGCGLAAGLAMVRGLPGEPPTGPTPAGTAVVALAVAVVLTAAVRTPPRKASRTGTDPYA